MEKDDNSETYILITSNSILSKGNEELLPRIVKMRHPRSGKGTLFLLSKNNSKIEEIFLFSEKRSWFVDNVVFNEAKICFSTPIDPLFLILPYLLKINQDKKVVPVEDLLIDNDYPEIYRLLETSVLQDIHLIADRKGPEDLHAWMYNEEKTIKWLIKKTEKVAQFFNSKQNYFKKGAISANFVKSSKCDSGSVSINNKMNLKYAYELVSEYLTEELSAKLLPNLGLPLEILKERKSEKRKLNESGEGERQEIIKKAKNNIENNLYEEVKCKSKTTKKNVMKKPEKSSQQITNFFKRK